MYFAGDVIVLLTIDSKYAAIFAVMAFAHSLLAGSVTNALSLALIATLALGVKTNAKNQTYVSYKSHSLISAEQFSSYFLLAFWTSANFRAAHLSQLFREMLSFVVDVDDVASIEWES